MWNLITGGITSLVGKWLDNKQEKQQAIHQSKMTAINNKADWETTAVSQMAQSLKDEWLLFWLTLPFITIFVSPFVDLFMSDAPYVQGQLLTAAVTGLQGLDLVPDWYTYLFGLIVGASFGVKGVGEVVNKLRK